MAFVVEDGTGLSNSNSYVSVDEFREYWTDRNVDYTQKSDTEIQASLIKANQYLDTRYKYIGFKYTYNQALEFPRYNAYDKNGYLVTDIPVCLKYALCEAGAIELNGTDLYTNTEEGIVSKTENAGPVQTTYTYKDKATGQIMYKRINNLLRPILKGGNLRPMRY